MKRRRPEFVYVVRYRRAEWSYRQARYYRSKPPAFRLVRKLLEAPPEGLSPVVEIRIEREPLGEPELLWRYEPKGERMRPEKSR